MKILGLIPARGGSKGVPKKNQKILDDQPLINYSIAAALKCTAIDTVLVSTDDEAIASISKTAAAEVPFMRPAHLATDQSPTIDTVMHALSFYENKGIIFDAVCLLQATCPFRKVEDIFGAIEAFESSEADSLISVKEVPHQYNPHWVFESKPNSSYLKIATGEAQIITRRQELPKAYYRDGSIYITSTDTLKKSKSLYGEKVAWYQSTNPFHVNIDTLEDWAIAEDLIHKFKNTQKDI